MVVLGADPTQLAQLSASLDRTARQMEDATNAIDSSLRSIWWEGTDADRFRSSWTRADRPALVSVASDMRESAKQARQNAAQQLITSADFNLGGSIGSFVGHASGFWRSILGGNPKRNWFKNEGIDQLAVVRYDETRQGSWWAGLDDEQREACLKYSPGELAFMEGLPDDVRAEARNRYIESMKSSVETDSTTTTFGVKVEVDYGLKFALGVEGSVEVQNYADGSTVVILGLDSDVAIGLGLTGVASVSGTGTTGVEVSYRFDSPEEAQEFLDGLTYALLPNDHVDKALLFGSLIPVVSLIVAPIAARDLMDDGAKHLDKYQSERESLVVKGAVGTEVSVGGAGNEVAVKGEVGVSHDLESGQTRVHFERSIDIQAQAGGRGASGGVSVRGEALFEGGQLVGFRVSGEASSEGGILLAAIPGGTEMSAFEGKSAAFEASIDLTDPVTRRAVEDYLKGEDVSLGEILNRAEVVAYTEATASVGGKAGTSDGVVNASIGGNVSVTERGTTYVKPPGGGFIAIDGESVDMSMADMAPSPIA